MTQSKKTTFHISLTAFAALYFASFTGCAIMQRGGFGCGSSMGCGDSCEIGCAVEPSCGLDGCCDTCTDSCGIGRSYAGQKWIGSGSCEGPKWNSCTDCSGSDSSCGCAEPACGCAEPSCGCGGDSCCDDMRCGDACCDTVGCGDTCRLGRGCGIGSNVLYGARCIKNEVGQIFSPFCGLLGGCTSCGGCDSELYWSGWHNDPPCCNDPCDKCGNWVGPR